MMSGDKKLAIVQALAAWRSPNDPAAGLQEFRAAFAKTEASLDKLIKWSRTVGFSVTLFAVIVASQVVAVPQHFRFAVGAGALAIALVGIVIWQLPIVLQMLESRGYVPQAFRLASLDFVHSFRNLCLNGNVDVADIQTGPVDLVVFTSVWSIALFSERSRVRSLFLVSTRRAFTRQLLAANNSPKRAHTVENAQVTVTANAIRPQIPGVEVREATDAASSGISENITVSSASAKRGKRAKSLESKRAYLADLTAEQRSIAVQRFLDAGDIDPLNHPKYVLVVETIWQQFQANRHDDYEVSFAIAEAREAMLEKFGRIGLTTTRSDAWIKKIAYGTNRELKEQLDRAGSQLKLGFGSINQISSKKL
jgi:hypothetical protein